MDAPVLVTTPPWTASPAWNRIILPLGAGLLMLGLAFAPEIAAAVRTWIESTAYNHCFLVIPIALYLLWERRQDLAAQPVQPAPLLALLAAPLAVIWLIAERLGIMEGRQLAAISFVEVLLLSLLGRRVWLAACGPLLYLYFLVPFGEFLTPRLQDITTWFIRHGLDILGVPAYIDGYIIEIPQGVFFVAEACAGLRFLIASIAFGCLYALMMYRSPVRRGAFILISIIVPIIANGFRGIGIVYLGYLLGSAQAAAADHIIYGWVFFSTVILLLIALGLPFRQDEAQRTGEPASVAGQAHGRFGWKPAFTAVAVVAAVAAISPLLTAGLAMAGGRLAATPNVIPIGPGCSVLAEAASDPAKPGVRTERVTCGDLRVNLAWQAFSPTVTAGPVMAARRRLARAAESESLSESWLAGSDGAGSGWRIMQSNDPAYVLAVGIWIDGRPVRPGMAMRAHMALNSLFGTTHAPMVVTVTPAVDWDGLRPGAVKAVQAKLEAFLVSHPGLDSGVGTASALR
jgi:exosortase A